MSDFEDFLGQGSAPPRPDASQVQTGITAPAPAAPPDFETFLGSEQHDATLRAASQTTAANVQTPAATAGKAAAIGRQIGLPQSAVETDVPQYEQMAKVQHNTDVLASSPLLAKWVAAHPDGARVAQDEYDKLSTIEKLWTGWQDLKQGTLNTAYGATQALGAGFAAAGRALNTQLGVIPYGVDAVTRGQALGDWWNRNMMAPPANMQAALTPDKDAGVGQKAGAAVGGLLGLLSQVELSAGGAAGEAIPAAAGALTTVATAVKNAARMMAFPSLTSAVNTGQDVYDRTGDTTAAMRAGVGSYLLTTAQGVVPFSAPGSLLRRITTGAVSGAATGEAQRQAMNLLLPAEMQQKFDPQELLVQAAQGAMFGGLLGPHTEPDLYRGVRQTYEDAARADAAEHANGAMTSLGQIAAQSKLRESDPDAFREFVRTVTDNTELDAVYVNGAKLADAFAQSQVDPRKIEGLPEQIESARLTGGDVRIPVPDYATHLAGTDVEKAILPEMKAAPDGMTFAEGQAFYQDAAKNLDTRAQEIAAQKEQRLAADTDRQQVFQRVLDQLTATGRNTDAVNKGYAEMVSQAYATLGERAGMKGSELFAKAPLRVAAEGAGGLAQGERGGYLPDTHTIALLKGADLSTFLHESGHHFLEMMHGVASGEKAPEGIREDFDTLLRHFGEKGATPEERMVNWSARDLEGKRAGHEKFAEGFERYLLEGKAPSQELQPLFSRFRSWLLNVYRNLTGHGAELTPEVRQVMDRMLASDNAIREAEQVRGYMPLFKSEKEAGVSFEQFNRYMEEGRQATDAAVSQMDTRTLADMKWLSNAKSKALRALQREANATRKTIRAEVENQVSELPIFKLKDYLAGIKNYDPEIVAEAHGFEDAHHMEQALDFAGDKKDVIEGMTDQRMLEEHGELIDQRSIEQAANAAVANEARARFMATGLKILTKSPLPAGQIARAAKEAAERTIARLPTGELRPDRYEAAEARANREATAQAANSPEKAIEAQRTAILNNRLAKAARDAQDEVARGLKYLGKFDGAGVAKAVGADYMDRINELLSNFDITNRFSANADVQTRASMRDWLDQQFAETGVRPEVSDALLDFAQRKHWKELSVEDFRGLVDSVKSLEHVGRNQTTLEVEGKRVALDDLVAEAQASMATLEHNPPADLQARLQHAKGLDKIGAQFLSLGGKLRSMDAALLKMEQLFQMLDAGHRAGLSDSTFGAFAKIFTRMSKAEAAERTMRADSVADLHALNKKLLDAKVNLHESLNVALPRSGRGTQWYREELLAAALNWGNEGNRQKLAEGYGWRPDQVQAAFDQHLSKPEWEFVQGIWDAVGKYGPQIRDLQRRLTGLTPDMVQASRVRTPHGDYDGGYYPVVYDSFRDQSIAQKNEKNADLLFENQWARPTTSQGHTVARTDYSGPIHLSLGVVARHLDQVTHDLAMREAVIDANKFLSDRRIKSEIDQVMGREYTKQLRPWLQAIANDKVFNTTGDSGWENFVRKARSNMTMVGLGFRLSTMEVHGLSALSTSLGEVGTKWFAKGAAQFAGFDRLDNAKQFVFERSPEMANRMNEIDRNVHEAIDQINAHALEFGAQSVTGKVVDSARKFAFYGVSMLDMASAMPTWYGAYLKGLAKEGDGGLNMGEAQAIEYANRAVRNAHGGGGVKDLAAVQRDKGVMSLATMFYSFWNHMYNRQRDLLKGYTNLPDSFRQGTATKDFPRLLARSWFYFVVPQLVHALLKPQPQDSQDDGSLAHFLGHAAEEVGLGFVSGVPVLRDLASALVNGRDYAITPLEQAGKSLVKGASDATKVATGQQPSQHVAKNAVQAAGYTFGLPVGQASNTAQFLWDVVKGDADPQSVKDWYQGVTSGKMQD